MFNNVKLYLKSNILVDYLACLKVKLADILLKMILPVSFLDHWPPKCLAIQFATTQYIPCKQKVDYEHGKHC